ncbi:MAG: DNA cytosine methyltransferase [Opitutales bacterium]
MVQLLEQKTAFVSGSLFSGGGLGDIGIEWGHGIPVIAACELVTSRAQLIRNNFPETTVFEGDIWNLQQEYIDFFKQKLNGKRPWLITLSPPCQGMSANGAGRIATSIRNGTRSKIDDRNRLILPGITILEELQPDWFILENVKRMENTIIRNENNKSENILNCLARRLKPLGYSIRSNILDFSSYGVPHHRERLITIGSRIPKIVKQFPPRKKVFNKKLSELHPVPSHGKEVGTPLVTLRDVIGHLPPLDSRDRLIDSVDPYHSVPCWNKDQYLWMKHTPEGQSAFDNLTCIFCAHKNIDYELVNCKKCGEFLPRPSMLDKGKMRLVKGFKTSYKRMSWDIPANTLTMNSGVISSDVKGHPAQNRVLSLREIRLLSTLDHSNWKKSFQFEGINYGRMKDGELFSRKLVREVIGESIPPLAMQCIVEHLLKLDNRF